MGDFREDGSPCSLRLCCSRPVGAKAAWLQHLEGCGVQIVRVRWWCAWCANRCSQGLFLNPSGVAPSQLAPARVANTRTRAPHWHRSLPRGRESKFTECFISQIRMPRSWNKVHIKGAFYFFFCSSAVGDESNGVAGSAAGKWRSVTWLLFGFSTPCCPLQQMQDKRGGTSEYVRRVHTGSFPHRINQPGLCARITAQRMIVSINQPTLQRKRLKMHRACREHRLAWRQHHTIAADHTGLAIGLYCSVQF